MMKRIAALRRGFAAADSLAGDSRSELTPQA
jgi:hypothetical protein